MRLLRAVSLPLLIFAAAFAVSLTRAPGATPIPTRAPGGGVPYVEPTTDPAAARMLSDAVQAPRRLSYVGRISTIAWGADGTRALEMAVDHRAPDLTRTWYIAPSPVYGNYVIERGSTSYAFDMHAETVTISHYPTADEDDIADASNFGLLTTNYRAVPGADDEVAGRHAHTLSLVNRYTGARLQRIWIDARTSLMLAKERYYANGSVAFSSRYQQLAYRSVPDALFQPAVPLGFKRVQGRSFGAPSSNVEHVLREAGFSASGPRYLPEGFALVSGDVTTIKGVRSLHLLYSDGLRSLSLFENANPQGGANFAGLQARDATVQGHGAKYVEDEPNVLLAWRERNLNLTLVGDLPLRELERIAASVVP